MCSRPDCDCIPIEVSPGFGVVESDEDKKLAQKMLLDMLLDMPIYTRSEFENVLCEPNVDCEECN